MWGLQHLDTFKGIGVKDLRGVSLEREEKMSNFPFLALRFYSLFNQEPPGHLYHVLGDPSTGIRLSPHWHNPSSFPCLTKPQMTISILLYTAPLLALFFPLWLAIHMSAQFRSYVHEWGSDSNCSTTKSPTPSQQPMYSFGLQSRSHGTHPSPLLNCFLP